MRGSGGRLLSVLLTLSIVGVAASAVFGEHGISHLVHLRTEREQLAQSTFSLLQANDHLRNQIRRLHSDDLYLEELARRQLGLVHPDETIYRLRRPTR